MRLLYFYYQNIPFLICQYNENNFNLYINFNFYHTIQSTNLHIAYYWSRFSQIKSSHTFKIHSTLVLYSEKFNNINPFYGLKIEQKLSKRIVISCEANFLQQRITNSLTTDNSYIDGIKFNYFRNNLSLNYKIINAIFFGLGYDYNIIRGLKPLIFGDNISGYPLHEQGISFRLGTEYKNFELTSYFHTNLHFKKNSDFDIFTINSFGLYLGYKFRVFYRSTKSTDCPKF